MLIIIHGWCVLSLYTSSFVPRECRVVGTVLYGVDMDSWYLLITRVHNSLWSASRALGRRNGGLKRAYRLCFDRSVKTRLFYCTFENAFSWALREASHIALLVFCWSYICILFYISCELLSSLTRLLLVTTLWTRPIVSNCSDVFFIYCRWGGLALSGVVIGTTWRTWARGWVIFLDCHAYCICGICLYMFDDILVLYVSNSRNLSTLELFVN